MGSRETGYQTTVVVLIGLIVALWIWVVPDTFRYSMEYSIPRASVFVQPEPHDCNSDAAPIGNKHCHYKKRVERERDRTSAVVAVHVYWDKVQE